MMLVVYRTWVLSGDIRECRFGRDSINAHRQFQLNSVAEVEVAMIKDGDVKRVCQEPQVTLAAFFEYFGDAGAEVHEFGR